MRERSPQEIERLVTALAGKGLAAAGRYLANEIRRVISVPAPHKVVAYYVGNKLVKKYIATTPATPGAPPRKLSGRLRASIDSWPIPDGVAVGSQKVIYARRLEVDQNHPYLVPTLVREKDNLARIIGSGFTAGGNV